MKNIQLITDATLGALDLDDVRSFADINGQAPDLAIALHRRYGVQIDVLCVDSDGRFVEPDPQERDGYLSAVRDAGIEDDVVVFLTNRKALKPYDVLASLNGFGVRGKVQKLKRILGRGLHSESRLVMEIRKGSGSYPFLNTYGSCNTLPMETAQGNRVAVMSVEPQDDPVDEPAGEWSKVAVELAGKEGFFSDLGEHSFLFIQRSDTLVVTFDNLDIAMTKRDDRRPWGFSFIEAQGWSMLGVMAKGWTWFRGDDVSQKFIELRDSGFFAKFKRVVFYGASMGGYAAAAYSAAAPGSTVFAISPQSTLDKSIVPWEMRYKKAWSRDFSGPFGDASISSQAAKDVHIMFDPYVRPDAGHAARYTGDNVTFWRCPLLGHRLGSSLSQMGALQTIARKAISGELTAHEFHGLLRARHTFPRFQRELANLALDRGHPALAKQVCRHILRQRDDVYFRRMLKRLA